MNISNEQREIVMTALQDYRSNLYLDGNHGAVVQKITDLIVLLEDDQKSKDLSQKRIPIDIGSETGIEQEEHYNQSHNRCINCDE
jgi:hypothetical protein